MKIFLVLALSLTSSLAFGYNQIRCQGFDADLDLDFWRLQNTTARARLTIKANGPTTVQNFTMFQMGYGRQYQMNYSGYNYSLTIDTWPDRVMQPLRRYRAILRGPRLGLTNLNCTYWN